MHKQLPSARFTSNSTVFVLASLTIAVAVVWVIYHITAVAQAMTGTGSPLATTFLVSLLLMWWVPIAWLEKPKQVTAEQLEELNKLVVTVVMPVYNEKKQVLSDALQSVVLQTRKPNRLHVIDDGSPVDYSAIKQEVAHLCEQNQIEFLWKRTANQGKRHAQMVSIANDDADIVVTLDSDSTLDSKAIDEGLKHFANPETQSVAGMIVVWNSRDNFLSRLTCMLYTSFTRGSRCAQSVLGQVTVNSGTLAFYRGKVVRRVAGVYENERFLGKPMQMNDDSMLTFYGLLNGKTRHQPSSIAFTIVPTKFDEYIQQQLRWMRGTSARSWWWARYLRLRTAAFWMPILEKMQLVLAILLLPAVVAIYGKSEDVGHLIGLAIVFFVLLSYLTGLRYFIIERSDESAWLQLGTFLLAPVAGLWRFFVLRPLAIYANLTFWRVGKWGTREVTSTELAKDAA